MRSLRRSEGRNDTSVLFLKFVEEFNCGFTPLGVACL